jgi:sugar phosphate isomerase/epimerase
MISRRGFCAGLLASLGAPAWLQAQTPSDFQLNYILGSSLYGELKLEEIVPAVHQTGATAIDIWPRVHGNQREQLDEMGEEKFSQLLEKYKVTLGCITQYKLGPFGLKDEFQVAKRLGCRTIVTGAVGPKGLQGQELKAALKTFVEKMQPHLELAAQAGVTVAIENHGNSLVESVDSLKWLVELEPTGRMSIALAPYHLPQEEKLLANLIRDLAPRMSMFYAWEHGHGCMTKLPKNEELMQMPGRGTLDFSPLLQALKDRNYRGWTEIFMHPTPRGIPILETAEQVTAEVNRSRCYLEQKLAGLS